jgi:hypothetical protein
MTDTQTWAYIGRTRAADKRHAANTVVCCAVARPELARDNAKTIAKWMRQGLVIECVPVEWVRKHLMTTERYAPDGRAT